MITKVFSSLKYSEFELKMLANNNVLAKIIVIRNSDVIKTFAIVSRVVVPYVGMI